jgi:hypothetical protein
MVLGKVRNQRGAGSLGCLFMVACIGAAMYAGFQFGLPRLRHSSFQDRVNEYFTTGVQSQSAEELQRAIIQIASDFDIELKPEQVKVENRGGRIKVDVNYEKLVDLKVWQKTYPFSYRRNPAP